MKGSEKGDRDTKVKTEKGGQRKDEAREQGSKGERRQRCNGKGEKGRKEEREKGGKGKREKGEDKGGGEKGSLSETNVRVTRRKAFVQQSRPLEPSSVQLFDQFFIHIFVQGLASLPKLDGTA